MLIAEPCDLSDKTVKGGTFVVHNSEYHAYAISRRIFISARTYPVYIYISINKNKTLIGR